MLDVSVDSRASLMRVCDGPPQESSSSCCVTEVDEEKVNSTGSLLNLSLGFLAV